jgi:hypothetical protein
MDAGLRVAHLAALAVWVGALLTLYLMSRRRGERPAVRLVYRCAVVPGFFATALTGIWALHREPSLIKAPLTWIEVGVLAALMVADQLVWRGARREETP